MYPIHARSRGELPVAVSECVECGFIREEDGTISFDVYRKPTSTQRYITFDSYHHQSHKHAAFNSMIHRAVNLPLTPERFQCEWNLILKIGDLNGYGEPMLARLLKRHQRKRLINNSTSFTPEDQDFRRIAVQFHRQMTSALDRELKKHSIRIAPTSSSLKTKTMLGSTKDKIETMDKSGVYLFSCPYSNCSAKYIGETRRALKVRAGEHIGHTKNNRPESSAIAEHALDVGHTNIQRADFRLLSATNNNARLKVCEAIHIHKHRDNINRDDGQVVDSCLFSLLQYNNYGPHPLTQPLSTDNSHS